MTDEADAARAWEDDIVHGLRSLSAAEVPSLEIMLLDAVGDWLASPANPGDDYGDEHAGRLISVLFSAVESARRFDPDRVPATTEAIDAARARIVAGAQELAGLGRDGVSLTVSRLMPAITTELRANAGARGRQARGVFGYLLYAVSVGTRSEQDPAVMQGIDAAFAGWDALLRGGYVVPWRRPPGDPMPSANEG